jgi:hypothetical protein
MGNPPNIIGVHRPINWRFAWGLDKWPWKANQGMGASSSDGSVSKSSRRATETGS